MTTLKGSSIIEDYPSLKMKVINKKNADEYSLG